MLIYSDPPLGLSHRPECTPTGFAAWEERKKEKKKKHHLNESSRKEMDDFQISCKKKKDEVTGMGNGIKGQGWVGRTDGDREKTSTQGRGGEEGEKGAAIRGEQSRGK